MFLCVDTITAEAGIALVDKGRCLGFQPLESKHSSDGLFSAIDGLFKQANAAPSDLNGVFVIKGPGSFTSVRVAIAVANQFAHQLRIPIVGLRTEEWYHLKTDQKDFLYLQTLNRDEVYGIGFGKWKTKIKDPILRFDELPKIARIQWLGQLSTEHLDALPDSFELISGAKNTQGTWVEACNIQFESTPQKTYDLVEPYYGKEPKITPSKKHLKIAKIQ